MTAIIGMLPAVIRASMLANHSARTLAKCAGSSGWSEPGVWSGSTALGICGAPMSRLCWLERRTKRSAASALSGGVRAGLCLLCALLLLGIDAWRMKLSPEVHDADQPSGVRVRGVGGANQFRALGQ